MLVAQVQVLAVGSHLGRASQCWEVCTEYCVEAGGKDIWNASLWRTAPAKDASQFGHPPRDNF